MKRKNKERFLKWLLHNRIFWLLIILNIISIIVSIILQLKGFIYSDIADNLGFNLGFNFNLISWIGFILFWFLIFYIYYLWGDKIQKGFVKGGKILLWISLILFLNIIISFALVFIGDISEKILDILIINVIGSIFILIFILPIGLAWKFLKN